MCTRAACGDRNENTNWCDTCQVHYIDWAAHLALFRGSHPFGTNNSEDD